MNILIAPDKFKGSLTADEVCRAIASGLLANHPEADIRFAPLADGGDGTLAILDKYLHLRPRPITACDPLGRPLEVIYLENDTAAFIEVASASGLVLLPPTARDPQQTSTYGTGLQLRDALVRGKREIFLLLGGSATNDLGCGILAALGFTFFDADGQALRPTGGQLGAIHRIEAPEQQLWREARITLLCDVDNPLYGPNGAAHVYAAQKGATPAVIEALDEGAERMAVLLQEFSGIDVSTLPGGGAAGGIGAGLTAMIGGQLTGGFSTISRLTCLEEKIVWADLVISGEGQIDSQSLQGKVVGGVLELCAQHRKKCCLFAGRSTLRDLPKLHGKQVPVLEIMSLTSSVEEAMAKANTFLRRLAKDWKLSS